MTYAPLITVGEALASELRVRAEARYLEDYNPKAMRGLQDQFHQSLAFVRLYSAANGCGKTTAIVNEGAANILGYRPWDGTTDGLTKNRPARIAFGVPDFTHSAYEDLLPMVERIFPPHTWAQEPDKLSNGKRHRYVIKGGHVIKILSYYQAQLASVEGAVYDYVGINEPSPRDFYIGLLRGIAKVGGRMAMALTPIGNESGWIADEVFEPGRGEHNPDGDPDIEVFVGTLWQDSFMKNKRAFYNRLDPDERAARAYGQFRALLGRVYKSFNEDLHVIRGRAQDTVFELASHPEVPKFLVVDPHDRRPFACAYGAILPDGTMVFFQEYPRDEFHYQLTTSDLGVSDYAEMFRNDEKKIRPLVRRLMDPNYGVQRRVTTLESIQERFQAEGLNFQTEIPDSIEQGHVAVKERLGYDRGSPISRENCPRLYVTENCVNLIHAFRRYSWLHKRGESSGTAGNKVHKLGKDFADLVRYACMAGLTYVRPQDMIVRPGAVRELIAGRRRGQTEPTSRLEARGSRIPCLEPKPEPIPDVVGLHLESLK